MARLARIVIPDTPHHVTQRGNRRQDVFFEDADYQTYLALLGEYLEASGTALWAYCLMPNHVHLILTPPTTDALTKAVQETHRRYTRFINRKMDWKGHLWQGRYASFPMDEPHLLAAARYVELNPVRAGKVKRAQDWKWSSAKAHLGGKSKGPLQAAALLDLVPNWRAFLKQGLAEEDADSLRRSERTGRPLGSDAFIKSLEKTTGRTLKKQKPGRKPRATA
jgi:putative transposase